MRIGFSSLACPGWSVEEIVAAAHRNDYEGVEWRLADGALLGPRTDNGVWKRIAQTGVDPVCLDTSCVFVRGSDAEREKTVSDAIAMAERASDIGADAIRVFGGPIPDGVMRDAILEPTRQALAAAASGASRHGVTLLIETHDAWSSGAGIAGLLVDGVGVLWDVAHTVRSGEAVTETVGHIGVPGLVHVKDAIGSKLVHLGDGEVPLEVMVDELREVAYDGWLSLEWEKMWHPELDDADVTLPKASAYLRALVRDR
jgi:fatty-acyl-CoA synthase